VVDAWADAADVLLYTEAIATDAEILRAQDIIELFSGISWFATDNLNQTNLRYLNRAVSYQTAWMQTRPDLYEHLDVDSVSQDGASFTPSHDNAALLAPFAKRYLDRLSWRLKPLRIRRRYNEYDYDDRGPRDSAVADDNRYWTPMA
jgi:hypothetical protein